jgi:hypothetical protein
MEKSNYRDCFRQLVNENLAENHYIGRGNPNAEILFVGKEFSKSDKDSKFNAKDWAEKIDQPFDYKEHPNNEKEGHTWNKYQKLYDFIKEQPHSKEVFNFEKHVFTTEMSELPMKTTGAAQQQPDFKEKLLKRKQEFFNSKSKFFQQFPVVVLACSGYIKNDDKIREIDDILA